MVTSGSEPGDLIYADDNGVASFAAGVAAGLVEFFESEKAGDASTVIRLFVTKAASEPRIWRSATQLPSIRSAHAAKKLYDDMITML